MTKEPFFRLNQDPDALSGFSRTIAEIEWLLLVLMMFYLVVGHIEDNVKNLLLSGLCAFAAFVMLFHYANFFAQTNVWKLALETWVMILLITWSVWHTGRQDSLLLNLYFLPIITSALALGKLTIIGSVVNRLLLSVIGQKRHTRPRDLFPSPKQHPADLAVSYAAGRLHYHHVVQRHLPCFQPHQNRRANR